METLLDDGQIYRQTDKQSTYIKYQYKHTDRQQTKRQTQTVNLQEIPSVSCTAMDTRYLLVDICKYSKQTGRIADIQTGNRQTD